TSAKTPPRRWGPWAASGWRTRSVASPSWVPQIMAVYHPYVLCWIEVDLDAIADNVRALQAAAEPRHGVTAVVKAQAYGMGAAVVADAAVKAGARGAAVARISEARRLRAAGFTAPVLLLGGLDADDDDEVIEQRLTPTLADWPTA